jgi:serine/threonine protein kinase
MPLPLDTEDASNRDPLDALAEEYALRVRRGEEPSIEEFVDRYPERGEEIRRLLPTIAFLERRKRGVSPATTQAGSPRHPRGDGPAIERLGDYRIVRELGRGGMGIVYEAVHELLGKKVAIKILPRHARGDSVSRERFLREARVVAMLQHPHIVPIFNLGEQDEMPYYVMQLIHGTGLDRILDDPSAPIPQGPEPRARWVAELGKQAARALAYAHSQNVLHRDIKPANLLLDQSGALWLADFGLAKLSDDLSLTGSGVLLCTLRYLAPECLDADADVRSDVYSLGLTLYELLVGQPAFTETDRVRLLHQIQTQPVPAPGKLIPSLPRDLETIVLKATAHNPSSRYASADDLADDLERFLDGRPIKGRRTSPVERLVRWARRNPAMAKLTVISIFLGLVATVFFVMFLLAPPPADDPLRLGPEYAARKKEWMRKYGRMPPPRPADERPFDRPSPREAPPPRNGPPPPVGEPPPRGERPPR